MSTLVTIDSPELVNRYNKALRSIGCAETSLQVFSIDMLGWSPEIAQEKEEPFYLAYNLANPMVIIVTVEQQEAPVCNPYHSFDEVMLSAYFESNIHKIMDVCTNDALCIDLDNGISRYTTINDLLMVDAYRLKEETPQRLIREAKRQKEMVISFLMSDTLWEDEAYRQALIDSVTRYGDLRGRNFEFTEFVYDKLACFYTEALGGVYVLRSPKDEKNAYRTFVIYKDTTRVSSLDKSSHAMTLLHIGQENLLYKLIEPGFVHFNPNYYMKNSTVLEEKKERLLREHLLQSGETAELDSIIGKKSYVSRHTDTIPDIYFEIEKLQKQIARRELIYTSSVSRELKEYLLTPHSDIDTAYHGVINQLLETLRKRM